VQYTLPRVSFPTFQTEEQLRGSLTSGPRKKIKAHGALLSFEALRPYPPDEHGRHCHGREAPPPPAPPRAVAPRRGRLVLPAAASRGEAKGLGRPCPRVARPRRCAARRRGGGERRRDRVLAGELLHVAGAVRAVRAGVVVAHQALRQVQGPSRNLRFSFTFDVLLQNSTTICPMGTPLLG
jgi:hypothetical protein